MISIAHITVQSGSVFVVYWEGGAYCATTYYCTMSLHGGEEGLTAPPLHCDPPPPHTGGTDHSVARGGPQYGGREGEGEGGSVVAW